MLSYVGMLEDVQAFGVCSHQAVLDSIVDHLHEMSCSGRATMQIAIFGSATATLPTGCAWRIAAPRGQRAKDRVESLDNSFGTTNHHAVTTFQTPHATAGAHIHVIDSLFRHPLEAMNVVDVVGIPAINNDITLSQMRREIIQRAIHESGGNHQPCRPRRS